MTIRLVIGILLAILLCTVLYFGEVAQLLLFTAAAILAVAECRRMFAATGRRIPLLPPMLVAVFAAPSMWLFRDTPLGAFLMVWFVGVVLLILERLLNASRQTEDSLMGLVLFAYPLPFFGALLALCFFGAQATTAVLAAFACPLLGDTLAYFVGSAIGKHPLCPAISPKKTVEGSIASLLGSTGAGILLFFIQGFWGGSARFAPLILLGVLCGIVGQVGDLFASALKRWADMKDYGTIFPGHGGVMDRLDSVLLCAPVVYACFTIMGV